MVPFVSPLPQPSHHPTIHENGGIVKKMKVHSSQDHVLNNQQYDKSKEVLERVMKNGDLMKDVTSLLQDTAGSLGLLLRHPQYEDTLKVIPITLMPTLVSRESLQEITSIQGEINMLMHRVALDKEFLNQSLQGAASVDEFIHNLLSIYNQIDTSSQYQFCLIRADYILHQSPNSPPNLSYQDALKYSTYKQVEVNTICIGLSALGSHIHKIHDRLFKFLDFNDVELMEKYEGDTLKVYGEALSVAHSVYEKHHRNGRQKVLLIVVHKGFEFNIMDQRMVEFASGLKGIRRNFEQIRESVQLDEEGTLFVEGMEVAVVYYRTGYAPTQYDGQIDWDLRLLIEKSQAIKCPSVGYQLAGFKKIQQELSRPEVLQRYFPGDDTIISHLLNINMGQWDVSSSLSTSAIESALLHPENYVLKPNREGGGNNFYFNDLIMKLQQVINTPLAQDYILMEKIRPPYQENILIRPMMSPEKVETISEIGVFGGIIGKNDEIVYCKSAEEVLVRSKGSMVSEGGVATGYSCLSSTWII